MITTGHNVTAGGGLTGGHVPLPTRPTQHRIPERPRGLDWSKHTAPAIDRGAIAQAERQGFVTVTSETRDGRNVKVVRKVDPKPARRKPGPKPSYTPPDWIDEAKRLYAAGESTYDIGIALNRAAWTINRHLRNAGVTLRGQRNNFTEAEVERAIEQYAQGQTCTQIANDLGRSHAGVHRALTRSGVAMRAIGDYEYVRHNPALVVRDRLAEVGATSSDVRAWARSVGLPHQPKGMPSLALVEQYISESATTRRESA